MSTPPHEVSVSWFGELPWFRFVEAHLPSESHYGIPIINVATNFWGVPTCLNSLREEDFSHQSRIFSLSVGSRFGNQSESLVSTTLPEIMPETRDGEHDDTVSMLLSKSVPEAESARFKLFLYQLSNKMQLSLEHQEELTGTNIIATVKQVARTSPKWMRTLLSSDQPTAVAIKENIFGAAIQCLDADLVKQHLDIGMNPNIPIFRTLPKVEFSIPRGRQRLRIRWYHEGYSCTPLQWAVSAQKVELVRTLICAGANVNLCLQEQDISPLELACAITQDSVALTIAKLLVRNGALVNRAVDLYRPTALVLAVASGNANLTKFMVESGANDFEQYRLLPQPPSLERCAFRIALLKADRAILGMLGESLLKSDRAILGIPGESLSYARRVLEHMDLIITVGCSQDPKKMLLYLYELGVDIRESSNWAYGTLTMAIFLKDSNLAHMLLDYYGSVSPGQLNITKPSPIYAAACTGDIALMERLIRQGASVNESLENLSLPEETKVHEIYNTCSVYRYYRWREMESPLKIAIGAGNVEAAMFLLAKGSILLGGELVMAARLGNNDLVQKLLAIHETRGSLDWGFTLGSLDRGFLKTAIEHGNRDVALALIKPGSLLLDGEYVLALMNEDNELADMVAAHTPRSALMKPGPRGQSPLEVACATGNTRVANYLLSGTEARYESSALCAASWNAVLTQQYGLVNALIRIRYPSIIDRFEATALGIAAAYEDMYLLSLLLAKDFEPGFSLAVDCAETKELGKFWWRTTLHMVKKSLLHIAAKTKNSIIVKLFLDRGIYPDSGCFLHTTNLIVEETAVDVVRMIWEAKSPLDYSTECAGNAFEIAIKGRSIKCVRKLIEADLGVDSRMWNGWTPLQFSVKCGDMEIVRALVDASADINASPAYYQGATAAQVAAIMGHMGIMRFLIERGANINAPAAEVMGRTALEGAAEYGRLDMVQLLLGKGVITDGTGRKAFVRAIVLAEEKGHYAVARILKGHRVWTKEDDEVQKIGSAYFRSRSGVYRLAL